MALVQISFLGRTARVQEGYQTARYRFPGGEFQETAFFGLALLRRLRPDRVAILGTTGSMWHILLELVDGAMDPELRRRLAEGAQSAGPAAEDLRAAEVFLSESLGLQVKLVLIPHGRDLNEQIEILRIMGEQVQAGDRVALDVTHGLRHLPMLSLLSALLLRSLRGASVEHIYYGALDLTDRQTGETPVLDLKGLLEMADWSQALAGFRADGDYGRLAQTLSSTGLPEEAVAELESAAFFEKVCQFDRARNHLGRAGKLIRKLEAPVARIFIEALSAELERVRAPNLAEHQELLARRAAERGDWLRALTLLREAVVQQWMTPEERKLRGPEGVALRNKVAKQLRGRSRVIPKISAAFGRLTGLRNALVHGQVPKTGPLRQALSSPEALRAEFSSLLAALCGSSLSRSGARGSISVNPPGKILEGKDLQPGAP